MLGTILVVGGAGFVGSHVNHMLNAYGYQTVVLDNLSQGSAQAVCKGTLIKGDMADYQILDTLFSKFTIQAVMHFAALTNVGESILDPARYYINNVANTLNLLEAMRRHSIKYFVFSSSAAIFGLPQTERINETHPCNPINPYGETKWMVEQMLRAYDRAYEMKSCCLRYFNAAGGDPSGEIQNHKKSENNLIPLILRTLQSPSSSVTIYGTDYPTIDGTCVRDYIHVCDISAAHIRALQRLINGCPSTCYNIGNGNGYSVREVIHAVERVTRKKVNVIEGERRAGDPPILIADSQKIQKELEWSPQYPSLDTMIAHAWQAMG